MIDPKEPTPSSEEPCELAGVLLPLDRLNAAFMRWRLRRDYDELASRERDRFWVLLEQLGAQNPPPWGRLKLPPQAEIENLGAAIATAIFQAMQEGRLGYFEPGYMQRAVKNYIGDVHFGGRRAMAERAAAGSWELHEHGDPPTTGDDPSANLQDIETRQQLFKRLNREEAYLLGWTLRAGDDKKELKKAAEALGHGASWTTPVWKSLGKKLMALLGHDLPGEQGE